MDPLILISSFTFIVLVLVMGFCLAVMYLYMGGGVKSEPSFTPLSTADLEDVEEYMQKRMGEDRLNSPSPLLFHREEGELPEKEGREEEHELETDPSEIAIM